jgi:hypothetical protein
VDSPPATTAPSATARGLLPATRALLYAAVVLTGLGFGSCYLLAETTDRTFAWTIQPPLTAAFLGAGYGAGLFLVVLALRDGVWAHARLPLYTILLFVALTLVPTIIHLDRFHFAPSFAGLGALAKGAAWFWLAVYVLLPLVMIPVLVLQERSPGADPPRRSPVPTGLRIALVAESALLVVPGLLMYVAPATAGVFWPWPLTPLTARIVAAWLIAYGVTAVLAAFIGDLERLRIGALTYAVLGVLVLLAVARYPDTMAWDGPSAWILVAVAVAIVVTGVLGWRRAPRPGRERA